MVIHFRVDFEIADNRANNLVVGPVSLVENLEFPLEDGKQFARCSRVPPQRSLAQRAEPVEQFRLGDGGAEDEFLALLGKLTITTPNEFTSAAAALDPLIPGDRLPLVQELEQGIQLPSNTPTALARMPSHTESLIASVSPMAA